MTFENSAPMIGACLSFYARFTAELTLVWGRDSDEKLYDLHFRDIMRADDFRELVRRSEVMRNVVDAEAGQLTDLFKARLQSDLVGVAECLAPPQLQRVRSAAAWDCRFNIFKRHARKAKSAPIQLGLYIWDGTDDIYASSWLYVRKARSQGVLSTIRRTLPQLEVPDVSVLSDVQHLYLTKQSLREAAAANDSIDKVVDESLAPLLRFSPKTWSDLLELGSV
jgi:hypothetical protein